MSSVVKDVSISAVLAGFIAVLVGFSSSVAIVFQAADALSLNESTKISWIIALGIGMATTCFFLSWYFKAPIVTAWSTPGAALLATSLDGANYAEAIGAFIFSALLMILVGVTGVFNRLVKLIPLPIACAMLAGILFQFGLSIFTSLQSQTFMVGAMFLGYLFSKKMNPRYAILIVLFIGLIFVLFQKGSVFEGLSFEVGALEWVMPKWNLGVILGVGLPLFIVTMSSQNIPGAAVLKVNGYNVPASGLVGWTGVASLLLAPFGGYAINLAAITAAICAGDESHPNPGKRYIAGMSAGIFYLLAALGGASIVALFANLPHEMVATLAGLALLGTIGSNIKTALETDEMREAALVTFLTTASGMSLFGVASAFWGIVLGVLCLIIQRNSRG
ncbi:benzoate/H(+) symporter BenE family transporter [Marinomonas balearica]|uniref:Benzoate membrane transport protein n=1 Tax=Marinomonas balearica TaxID=491947 RepID=A0A4R6M662_9GAMM|nr:benzoate/H(+) symporter BenE family transporter [Marinomonas balearica]TDO96861.1 benzoate membrane transport protein [Marinomonas balearica]